MRILGKNTKNELEIFDAVSSSTITYYWRNPTDAERIRYSNELYTRSKKEDKDIILMHPEIKKEYGLKVLTGFKPGDFADENGKPIGTEKGSENYDPNWKEKLLEYVPEHLTLIATHVFESTKIKSSKISEGIEIEVAEPEGGERPFLQS